MVGERIKKLRIQQGYSITELARLAGVSKSYLSYIERDVQRNPSLQFLNKLATTLNTSIEYLLGEDIKDNQDYEIVDEDWITLIQEAIEDGVTKEEFQKYLDFIRYKKWEEQKEANGMKGK